MHILGNGAIGILVAKSLTRHKVAFSVIHRSPTFSGTYKVDGYVFEVAQDTTAPNDSPIKTLFVTTKAYDAIPAIQSLSHRLAHDSVIILFQNGVLSVCEALCSLNAARPYNIIQSTSTLAAYKVGPDSIIQTGFTGKTFFNPVTNNQTNAFTPSLAISQTMTMLAQLQDLNACCFDQPNDPRFREKVLEKILVNCVINPITALLNCKNGDLDARSDGIRVATNGGMQITQLVSEIVGVYTALGWVPSLGTAECKRLDSWVQSVCDVCHICAENYSSMCMDLNRSSRGITEIDHLNGWIVRLGQRAGYHTPLNAFLVDVCVRCHLISSL